MARRTTTAPSARARIYRVARTGLGFEALRPAQREAIESILAGRDTLAVMPTGSGKSAIYQIAAYLLHGPTVVVYPEAVWYDGVTPDDVEEIVESHIVGGRPVERLRLPDACINTAACPHKAPKE